MLMTDNILLLGPVFFPMAGLILCLALARNNPLQRYIGVLATALAWLCSLVILYQTWQSDTPQLYRLGGWMPPYGIVLVADTLAALFSVMASSVVMCGAIYIVTCKDRCMIYPAFMPLFLAMTMGLLGSFYTGDIFTLFVFTELMVMSSVVLVAISDNPLGLEAAIKYLLIAAMGSLFLLIGIAASYSTFGTLNMADIARLLSSGERPILAEAAALMLMCAFLLKSAIFPFHFWQPDFHTTAPTPLSAMLSSVVVKVGIFGIIRLTTLMFTEEAPLIHNVLIVLGLIGIFFGSLSALRTYDAKRMLAYSTFGQIGYILIGIGWGNPIALAAAIVYTVNHAFIKSSLLMLTGVVSSYTKTKTARFFEIGGAGHGMKLTGGLYFIGAMALAGLPPLNGFISKLALVEGGISAEDWLVLGLIVGAGLITLMYMFRAWQLIFQQQPDSRMVGLKEYGDHPLAPALLITACVLLGIYAVPLVTLANRIVANLGDPQRYISIVLGL
jgi:multicomponent Na+:H+ antiporter subunit D